jgi:hypothetical protein
MRMRNPSLFLSNRDAGSRPAPANENEAQAPAAEQSLMKLMRRQAGQYFHGELVAALLAAQKPTA